MSGDDRMHGTGRRRALVVDDNSIARVLASAMLARRNFDMAEAPDAHAALARLRQESFDLVLLDIGLPGMSGIELCQIIRGELGLVDLPVFAYTAYGHVTDMALMRLAGFNDFLVKPMSMGALDQALQQAFAQSGA